MSSVIPETLSPSGYTIFYLLSHSTSSGFVNMSKLKVTLIHTQTLSTSYLYDPQLILYISDILIFYKYILDCNIPFPKPSELLGKGRKIHNIALKTFIFLACTWSKNFFLDVNVCVFTILKIPSYRRNSICTANGIKVWATVLEFARVTAYILSSIYIMRFIRMIYTRQSSKPNNGWLWM